MIRPVGAASCVEASRGSSETVGSTGCAAFLCTGPEPSTLPSKTRSDFDKNIYIYMGVCVYLSCISPCYICPSGRILGQQNLPYASSGICTKVHPAKRSQTLCIAEVDPEVLLSWLLQVHQTAIWKIGMYTVLADAPTAREQTPRVCICWQTVQQSPTSYTQPSWQGHSKACTRFSM